MHQNAKGLGSIYFKYFLKYIWPEGGVVAVGFIVDGVSPVDGEGGVSSMTDNINNTNDDTAISSTLRNNIMAVV